MKIFTALFALLTLLIFGSCARAWNATGHMTVAAVAYDALTPQTRTAVNALLARHKDYPQWMADRPAGYADRARFAFMKAATWPDDIRHTPDDHPAWHYSDIPIVAPGYAPDPSALRPVTPNAETQILAETKLLTDQTASDGDRAVALCWVEHLVGDIHQPLHAASLFASVFPTGDRGGNSDLLLPGAVNSDPIEKAAAPHNLHALWDDLLGTTKDPTEIDQIAKRLEAPAFAPATFPQLASTLDVHGWLVESNALAKNAYQIGIELLTPTADNKATVLLPPDYLPKAHGVADRQVALAGLRLAARLNAQTFPPVSAAPPAPVSTITAAPPVFPPVATGPIIGNKNTRAYHLPGASERLPAERNRVYFPTEAAAQAAGYHKTGG